MRPTYVIFPIFFFIRQLANLRYILSIISPATSSDGPEEFNDPGEPEPALVVASTASSIDHSTGSTTISTGAISLALFSGESTATIGS
ncbi:unnamed protein product, partial [Protopolystoma xenopodis]